MAIGLTDHVWSYKEYIWLPVHRDPALSQKMDDLIRHLLTPALQGQPSARQQAQSLPAERSEGHEEEADTMPTAA
jgi:hypothetical protein